MTAGCAAYCSVDDNRSVVVASSSLTYICLPMREYKQHASPPRQRHSIVAARPQGQYVWPTSKTLKQLSKSSATLQTARQTRYGTVQRGTMCMASLPPGVINRRKLSAHRLVYISNLLASDNVATADVDNAYNTHRLVV